MELLNLLKNYDKSKHLEYTNNINIQNFRLNYISSKKWVTDEDIPYIAKTHLLDSYYLLPERPDIAFTLLWKSINSSYSELFTKSKQNDTGRLQDFKSLDFMIESLYSKLSYQIDDTLTIKILIEKYIEYIPKKITKFIANYLLKNYIIDKNYPPQSIGTKYISGSYFTFKSQFKEIYNGIMATYGESFLAICNPSIDNGILKLNINKNDKTKSMRIIDSLSETIKDLLINKETTVKTNDKSESFILSLTDKEYLNFIIRNILYAIRNNTVHGNIASRLNSKTKNKDSYYSSIYLYLLGYLFLSLLFYELGYIEIEDLKINEMNYENNILQ